MAAVKWYVGKLTQDVGRYKAGDRVPFKWAGKPSESETLGHTFSTWKGPYKSKKEAWSHTQAPYTHGSE